MTVREFYLESRKHELPKFQNVLHAMPKDQFAYKPHDKSPSAEQIVWTIVNETISCKGLVDTGELHFDRQPAPPPDTMIAIFNDAYAALTDRVSKMSEADWNKTGKFMMGGRVAMEQPVGHFLWMFHHDMIHHRGQLSTYIRPMGGKVPSIYGPSGDDPGPRGN
jgi:uncharacterized damage-inducible protein DinB